MLSAHDHSLLQGHGPREDDVVLEVYVLVQRIPELAQLLHGQSIACTGVGRRGKVGGERGYSLKAPPSPLCSISMTAIGCSTVPQPNGAMDVPRLWASNSS